MREFCEKQVLGRRPSAVIGQSVEIALMHIRTKCFRGLEFAYFATVGLWLVPQNKMGFYAGPILPIIDAVSGVIIMATLLLTLNNALSRGANRWALICLAATIAAFGVFTKSYEPLVRAGMDYKLPYLLFSLLQPPIAIIGCLIAWTSWRERRRLRDVN